MTSRNSEDNHLQARSSRKRRLLFTSPLVDEVATHRQMRCG